MDDSPKSDHPRPDPAKSGPARPDPAKPEGASLDALPVVSGLDASERVLGEQVGEACRWLLSLVLDSLLRTDDDPETSAHPDPNDLDGLVRSLAALAPVCREILIFRARQGDRLRMAIDEPFGGPRAIRDLLPGRALLTGRFDALCRTRGIEAVAVRTRTPQAALQRCIELLGHTPPDTLTERLLDSGITDIVVVHTSDLPAHAATFPWHVRLALARLPAAVRSIPVYAALRRVPLEAARRKLLARALVGVRHGAGLSLLLNQFDATIRNVPAVAVGQESAEALSIIAATLIDRDARLRIIQTALSERRRTGDDSHDSLLSRLARSLKGDHAPETLALLTDLHAAGLVDRAALPDELRDEMDQRSRLAAFRRRPLTFLQRLDEAIDPVSYRQDLIAMLRAFPELDSEGLGMVAGHASRLLRQHRRDTTGFNGRRAVVAEVLADLDGLDIRQHLNRMLRDGDPAARFRAGELLLAMGVDAIPSLMHVLAHTDRPKVIADVALLLAKVAPTDWLADELPTSELSQEAQLTVLKVLADRGQPEHATVAAALLQHGDSRVREAALTASVELIGRAALPLALTATRDPAPAVVASGLHYLEVLGYDAPGHALQLATLAGDTRNHPNIERVRITALDTLHRTMIPPDEVRPVVERLLAIVPPLPTRRWGGLGRKRATEGPSPAFRAALYRALGRFHDPAVRQVLTRCAEGDPDPGARARAQRALDATSDTH